MNPIYAIRDTSSIYSPALLFYKDLIQRNIDLAVRIAGTASRLRPHVKTHKTREIVHMELKAGITKHKCATLAEAEMLASCGVAEVFIAYNLVGPNTLRLSKLMQLYPHCRFSTQADHPITLEGLSRAMQRAGLTLEILLDLDVGQHRTGMPAGDDALALYRQIAHTPGIRPGGLHVYDGHNNQAAVEDREAAVAQLLGPVNQLRERIQKEGLPTPRIIVGGTPTFPVYAKLDLPGLECSPGTLFLHDQGYGGKFTDLQGFTPAALLFTRVVSKPMPTRLTLDLGYKAVASDPPAGKRLALLDLPDYEAVLQNEEHLVIETPHAARYLPGDEFFAIPTHICPTCAMHRSAYVIENGALVGQWDIVARDRVLTV